MGLVSRLARRTGVRVWKVGALELIAASDAQQFLDACLEEGVQVLGIEGFQVDGVKVQPDMGMIADFSALSDAPKSVAEAQELISSLDSISALYLDFTLTE